MREIKFRAWDGAKMEYHVMAGWLGAYYVEGVDPKDTACMSPFNTHLCNSPLMQFTGLRDKNGKEIYEGDINYDNENKKSQVIFYAGGFYLKYGPVDYRHIGGTREFDRNVIGNIYENSDLLV